MEVKIPQGIKLFFFDKKERLEEAPLLSLEKKFYNRGIATYSWNRH